MADIVAKHFRFFHSYRRFQIKYIIAVKRT